MQKCKTTIPFSPPPPSLEDFIGGENSEAVGAITALAEGRLNEHLYIWGESGSGKTHLLRAAATCARQLKRASFFAANGEIPPPLAGFLAVDDVEKLDTASQITLFDWHNHIAANGHAQSADNNISILTAGGAPPHTLPLRKELATRLAGGLVFRINGQSDTEKRLTLERFANRRSFSLPPEVCDLLLTRLPRDIAGLTSALDDLDTFLLNEQKPLNLRQARLWLEKYQSATPLLAE